MSFTTSEENYIKSIYHLQQETGLVNTNSLAAEMQTSAASVTDMLKKLKGKKLLQYEKYKGFKLNDMRKNISSGSLWEDMVGYSRAVRVGNIIEVAGTTAMDGQTLVGKDDLFAQTVFIIKKIENALQEAGASLTDVVRTRMFITDISRWEEAGKAHGEFFKEIKPVTTMVEVVKLINDDLLIEIEATAIVSGD